MSIDIYDENYHRKFVERAKTELGKKIYAERWRFVEKHAPGVLTLLDFGCGPGAFHQSSLNGYKTFGYDVNPHCGFTEFPDGPIHILTMWDSIEHVHDVNQLIRDIGADWIFLSTPNLESVRGDIRKWKHYRPHEHIHYFDIYSLTEILNSLGYEIVEHNFEEGKLRDPENPEAIISVAAKLAR